MTEERSNDAGMTVEAARAHFDREATEYESADSYRRLEEPRARAVDLLELDEDARLLDVSCATGATLRELAPRIAHGAGVDASPHMIELARSRAHGQPNLEFAVADSAQLPFPDKTFTAVLCTFAFHHYPTPEAATTEMARVLQNAGQLVLADATSDRWVMRIADAIARRREPGHVRFHRAQRLAGFLDSAGFAEVTIRPPTSWYAILTAVKIQ